MRPLTSQELAVLSCESGFSTHLRVKVQDAGGTWRDLTDLEGRDWVRGATVNASRDQPMEQATVTFARGEALLNLAPYDAASRLNLLTGSYAPLLGEGRPFVIELATLPLGMAPADTSVTLANAQPTVTLPATQALSAVRGVDALGASQAPVVSFTGAPVPASTAGTVRLYITAATAPDYEFRWEKTSGNLAPGGTDLPMFPGGTEAPSLLVDDGTSASVGVAARWTDGDPYAAGESWEFDVTLTPSQTVTSSQPTLTVPNTALLAFSGSVLVEVVQGSPGYTFRYTLAGASPRTVAMARGTAVPLLLADGSPSGLTLTWPNVSTHYAGASWTWRVVRSDWRERFRGRIDKHTASENTVTVSGRDLGGYLQDAFIEAERNYGSTGGVAVQTVMQSILTDNGWGTVGLYTPTNPAWNLGPFTQRTEPVLEALKVLAAQLGWDVRYRWRADAGTWALAFAAPDRARTTVDWVFQPNLYRMLSDVESSLEDVRNAWSIVYSDRTDLDAVGQPKRKTVLLEDAASIAKYGRRWAQDAEAGTSNINTAAEALRLATAALADTATPALTCELEVPGVHWHLELNDLVQLAANGVQHSTPVEAAVDTLTLALGDDGSAKTTLRLRGRPSLAVREWLVREARPGIAPSAPFTGPSAPSNLGVVPVVNGFALTFSPPTTGPKPAAYALYVGSSPGFLLDSITFKSKSSSTSFNVTDLPAGATRYARVVALDEKENAGPASAEVPITTRYVEPRLLQPRFNAGTMPLNGEFEVQSDTSAPPDGWTPATGTTWGVDFVFTSDASSGGGAVRMTTTAVSGASLQSEYFVVYPGALYSVRGRVKTNVATSAVSLDGILAVAVVWYSTLGTTTSIAGSVSTAGATVAADTWVNVEGLVQAPATARYARVVLSCSRRSGQTATFDSVQVSLGATQSDIPKQFGMSGVDPVSASSLPVYYLDSSGHTVLTGAVKVPLSAADGFVLHALPAGYRPDRELQFLVSTDSGAGVVKAYPNGNVVYRSGGKSEFWVSGIRFRAVIG